MIMIYLWTICRKCNIMNELSFDPKIHICKFGFELFDYASFSPNKYKILTDLYQRELTVQFINKRTDKIVDAVGFKISDGKMNSLLPFIIWEDFERMRDLPDEWYQDFNNGCNGYRDGWGYQFWCLSESGMPLIQLYMSDTFKECQLPPTEKLLKWVKTNYGDKLKDKKMMW